MTDSIEINPLVKNLEELKFTLKQKEEELHNLNMNTFTLNPDISKLALEIALLRTEIKDLENEENE